MLDPDFVIINKVIFIYEPANLVKLPYDKDYRTSTVTV